MPVHSEISDGICVITIDRPAVRNAVDGPTAQALDTAMVAADADPGALVIVLRGADRTFCSGADLGAIAEGRGNRVDAVESEAIADSIGPMGPTRRQLDTPVIAAVEGYAVAGGLELAIWCDMRVAARDAVFGVFCRRWGVPLVDGGTVRLPQIVGLGRAMDMILTGRPVGAEEAAGMGLVDRLVEPGEALVGALELARSIASSPQRCVVSDRRSVYAALDLTTRAALAEETRLGLATIRSGETRAGAERFAEGAGRHGRPATDSDASPTGSDGSSSRRD